MRIIQRAVRTAASVSTAVERFGGLDILVPNSGGPPGAKAVEIDAQQVQEAVDLLLLPVVRVVRLALTHLLRFHRLLRYSRPAPADLQVQAAALARRMGLGRCPEVRVVPGALPPMVWACFGPARLYFPEELLELLGG